MIGNSVGGPVAGSASYLNLVAWCWRRAEEYHLIVVNLSDSGAQGLVRLPWDELKGRTWADDRPLYRTNA